MIPKKGLGCSKSRAKVDFLFEIPNSVNKYMYLSEIDAFSGQNKEKKIPLWLSQSGIKLINFPLLLYFYINSSA